MQIIRHKNKNKNKILKKIKIIGCSMGFEIISSMNECKEK
jgi:hypothetical protein